MRLTFSCSCPSGPQFPLRGSADRHAISGRPFALREPWRRSQGAPSKSRSPIGIGVMRWGPWPMRWRSSSRTWSEAAGSREIEHLAHHDALTDLPNRVLFHEKLDRPSDLPAGVGSLALHFLDLDQFKAVNDTLGHHIGDRLLQAVAERLSDGLGRPTRLPGWVVTNSPSCRPRLNRHSMQSGWPNGLSRC